MSSHMNGTHQKSRVDADTEAGVTSSPLYVDLTPSGNASNLSLQGVSVTPTTPTKANFLPAVFILGTLFVWLIFPLIFCFQHPERDFWGERGTFGDQFGAANALFAGMGIVGLLLTLNLQRIQFEESRNFQERQRRMDEAFAVKQRDKDRKYESRQRQKNKLFAEMQRRNDKREALQQKRRDLTLDMWKRWDDIHGCRSHVFRSVMVLKQTVPDEPTLLHLHRVESFLEALSVFRSADMLDEELYARLFSAHIGGNSCRNLNRVNHDSDPPAPSYVTQWERLSMMVQNRDNPDYRTREQMIVIYRNLAWPRTTPAGVWDDSSVRSNGSSSSRSSSSSSRNYKDNKNNNNNNRPPEPPVESLEHVRMENSNDGGNNSETSEYEVVAKLPPVE